MYNKGVYMYFCLFQKKNNFLCKSVISFVIFSFTVQKMLPEQSERGYHRTWGKITQPLCTPSL